MKTIATKTLTVIIVVLALSMSVGSCNKQENSSGDQQYRLTKFTCHYFGGFTDTTDFYTISYTNNRISKLIGKWNKSFNVSYLGQTRFNRDSGSLLDSCVYDNA